MSTMMRYLRDPYNQVFKFTATGNSNFKFKINGLPFYTVAEINALIESVSDIYFPDDMDTFSKRFFWLVANSGTYKKISDSNNVPMNMNVLHYFNSYPNDICYLNPQVAIQILKKYYDTRSALLPQVGDEEHGTSLAHGLAWFDVMLRVLVYKDKYELASIADIAADPKLFGEAIRKTSDVANYSLAANYAHQIISGTFTQNQIDNLRVALPDTCSFILPVKSANVPKTYEGTDLDAYANCILTIPSGVTGEIEMPFTLVEVTGTGSVTVNGISYDLPDDEAALKAVLQAYETYYHTLTVTANTGGIVCDFLCSPRMYLFNKNYIETIVTSGSVVISKVATLTPVATNLLSLDKGSNTSWTFDFLNYFTNNKSFKIPKCNAVQWDKRIVHFGKTGGGSPSQYLYNHAANQSYAITATATTETCWAAKLMPRDDSFTGSLELSFTAIDDSDTYYTTDGSDPTAASTKYTVPFTISATTTVKWINIKTGYSNSHINTRVITKTA